jgi:hypothetical protein
MEDLDIEAAYTYLQDKKESAKSIIENSKDNAYRFLFECTNTDEKDLSVIHELERDGIKCFINEFAGVKPLDKEYISKYEYVFELLVLNEDYKKALSIWCKITGERFEDYYEEAEKPNSEDLSSLGGYSKTDLNITDTEWKEFTAANEMERKQKQQFIYWFFYIVLSFPFLFVLLSNVKDHSLTSTAGTVLIVILALILFLFIRFRPK